MIQNIPGLRRIDYLLSAMMKYQAGIKEIQPKDTGAKFKVTEGPLSGQVSN
jgi:hypothetical protein